MVSAISTATIAPLGDKASTREQAATRRDQARLEQARSALQTLKARSANRAKAARDEQKAQARKKVEQLKALLKTMQMGGAPNAKAIAQVARELKAAVQAYAGAGGSTAGLGSGPSTEASADEATAPGEAVASPSPAGEAEAHAATQKIPPTEVEGRTAGAPEEETPGNGTKTASDDPYRRMAEAAQARVAEAARRNADTEADRDFLSSVRELAAILKSLARRAAQAAETDPAGRADAEETIKAADDVAEAVEKAASDMATAGISIAA